MFAKVSLYILTGTTSVISDVVVRITVGTCGTLVFGCLATSQTGCG